MIKPIMFALLIAVFAVGCTDTELDNRDSTNAETPTVPLDNEVVEDDGEVTLEDVGREFGDALDTTKKLGAQKRDDYAEKMEEKIKDLDEKIGELKHQSRDLNLEAMREWEKRKTALYEKREVARAKLAELKSTSGDAWSTMKVGMEEAWSDLERAYEKAADEIDNSNPE